MLTPPVTRLPRLTGQPRLFGAQVERWRPTGVHDLNDLLLLHDPDVLSRDLAEDGDGRIEHVEEMAPAAAHFEHAEDRRRVRDDVAQYAPTCPEPGASTWIEIHDPTTGETFEIEADSCPPSWR
jgi:hypothetical protein